jgi:hypothetical protein
VADQAPFFQVVESKTGTPRQGIGPVFFNSITTLERVWLDDGYLELVAPRVASGDHPKTLK